MPSPGLVETPPKKKLALVPPPGIYDPDRKAGTGPEERGANTEMTDIAKAIQQQTNELATLVKAQQESAAGAGGSLKGLGKTSEELVYLLRACGQYTVQVGDGEYGASLAQALLAAQAGSSTKLRTAGFRQKVTTRLAIGLAGPYWGTQEKYALSASDFVPCTDAELDQFAIESRTGKPTNEQRPAAPTRYEDWLSRAKRQNDIWALVYGSEWKAVRDPALSQVMAGGGHTMKTVHGARGHAGLVLREYFAGHGVITKGWTDAGMVALEPIELYDQPHQQLGPRPDHDLAQADRQKFYLDKLNEQESNVQWIASPCTTFCDWCLQNGGTRTFQNPAGLPTEKEKIGNILSEYGAKVFEKSMQQGGFPIAESSGTSGRYPKQWHLPQWRRLLQRPDVDFIEVDMRAFGLGPPGTEGQFYRHRTGLAFPHHPPLRQALLRLCPGVSATHQHVALKGSRPGVTVSRCTEAGVYAPNFVRTVVETLAYTLMGGGSKPQPPLSKTGGRQPYGWNGWEAAYEEDEQEEQAPQGFQHLNQEEMQQVADMAVEAMLGVWNGRTTHEQEETVEESAETLEEPDEILEEPEEGENEDNPEEEPARTGASEQAYRIVWDDMGQRNRMEVDAQRGYVWLYTNEPRNDLAVPEELPYPYWPHRFHSERYTRCETRDSMGRSQVAEVYDDWRVRGRGQPPFVPWTGATLFVFRDGQLPWAHVPVEGQDPNQGPEEPDGDSGGDPPTWTSSSHTGWQGLNGQGVWQDWSAGSRWGSRAGGSRWVDFEEEGISGTAATAAMAYIQEIDRIQGAGPTAWRMVRERGDMLLNQAGSVEKAAVALWIAREHLGRNNLQGVDSEELDPLLHPDQVAYLREVRSQGMPARYLGQRERVVTRPHPRARADLGQVYVQLMKDITKHRVLVVSTDHPNLGHTVSSPFELVPKMLPNRTLSTEARLVHDQRQVNEGTHKELHPPAAQPTHEQVARRVLWLKTRYPGVKAGVHGLRREGSRAMRTRDSR